MAHEKRHVQRNVASLPSHSDADRPAAASTTEVCEQKKTHGSKRSSLIEEEEEETSEKPKKPRRDPTKSTKPQYRYLVLPDGSPPQMSNLHCQFARACVKWLSKTPELSMEELKSRWNGALPDILQGQMPAGRWWKGQRPSGRADHFFCNSYFTMQYLRDMAKGKLPLPIPFRVDAAGHEYPRREAAPASAAATGADGARRGRSRGRSEWSPSPDLEGRRPLGGASRRLSDRNRASRSDSWTTPSTATADPPSTKQGRRRRVRSASSGSSSSNEKQGWDSANGARLRLRAQRMARAGAGGAGGAAAAAPLGDRSAGSAARGPAGDRGAGGAAGRAMPRTQKAPTGSRRTPGGVIRKDVRARPRPAECRTPPTPPRSGTAVRAVPLGDPRGTVGRAVPRGGRCRGRRRLRQGRGGRLAE